MGGGTVAFELKPSQGALPKGQPTILDLQAKITTAEAPDSRPPLNICLILDKSGSMASEKRLENAKLAIRNVISSLGKQDLLHLVVYDNHAKSIFSAGDLSQPQLLIRKVDEINASGGTNLEAGLEAALAITKQYPSPPAKFFIFSDGQINGGKRQKNEELLAFVTEIHDQFNIKMSSFGVGRDFNEDLMVGIAEHGMGVYSFIEGASSMDSFVSHCLKGIVNCVAQDAVLNLTPLGSAKLERVFGYKPGPIRLGDLSESNLRQVIAKLSIPTPPEEAESLPLLRWSLSYRPVGGDTPIVLEGQLELPTCLPDADFRVDEQVQSACIIAAATDFDAQVLEAVNAGRDEDALRAQDAQIDLLSHYAARDKTGAIESLLTQGRYARVDLEAATRRSGQEREDLRNLAKKKVAHQQYQKRRGSMEFIEKNKK